MIISTYDYFNIWLFDLNTSGMCNLAGALLWAIWIGCHLLFVSVQEQLFNLRYLKNNNVDEAMVVSELAAPKHCNVEDHLELCLTSMMEHFYENN